MAFGFGHSVELGAFIVELTGILDFEIGIKLPDGGLGGDAMLFVVGDLLGTAFLGDLDRIFHRFGHFLRVHEYFAVGVTCGASGSLDQCRL